MFLRWLYGTFPREMLQGWSMIRPDLSLWVGLFALFALATLAVAPSMAPAVADQPAPAPPVLPFLVYVLCALLTTMLPAVLFAAQVEGRQLTWGPVVGLLARKAAPLALFAAVAFCLAWAATLAMLLAVTAAFGDSSALIPLSSAASAVIYLSILVRFSFLPFLVILLERERVPEQMWRWERLEALSPWFWPLTASARLTEGRRWRLVFYTVVGQALPLATQLLPASFAFPVSVASLVVLVTVQAVLFLHYRVRCEETGVPPPALPVEAPSVA